MYVTWIADSSLYSGEEKKRKRKKKKPDWKRHDPHRSADEAYRILVSVASDFTPLKHEGEFNQTVTTARTDTQEVHEENLPH